MLGQPFTANQASEPVQKSPLALQRFQYLYGFDITRSSWKRWKNPYQYHRFEYFLRQPDLI